MSGDDRAAIVAMSGLPGVGHRRLRRLVDLGRPADTWAALDRRGPRGAGIEVDASLDLRWAAHVRRVDPCEVLDAHRKADVGVVLPGDPAFPSSLAHDHDPPSILFHLGDPATAEEHSASIVGTRRSTGYGEGVAFDLGAALSRAGVSVVSGLALGIDGAAHAGALSAPAAPPVAVVACGLDVVYPRRNRELWRAVARHGVIWSEVSLGVAPERWRFPLRNRLIAALGRVLVVVESGRAGGSMHTVREADDRGRTVMAVPGPVRSPASLGSNQLLSEGCPPCRDHDDVLVALGLATESDDLTTDDRPVALSLTAAAVLDSFEWTRSTIDDLARRSGCDVATVSVALSELLEAGEIRPHGGLFERCGRS
jgi:DNA processing protein